MKNTHKLLSIYIEDCKEKKIGILHVQKHNTNFMKTNIKQFKNMVKKKEEQRKRARIYGNIKFKFTFNLQPVALCYGTT